MISLMTVHLSAYAVWTDLREWTDTENRAHQGQGLWYFRPDPFALALSSPFAAIFSPPPGFQIEPEPILTS